MHIYIHIIHAVTCRSIWPRYFQLTGAVVILYAELKASESYLLRVKMPRSPGRSAKLFVTSEHKLLLDADIKAQRFFMSHFNAFKSIDIKYNKNSNNNINNSNHNNNYILIIYIYGCDNVYVYSDSIHVDTCEDSRTVP